MLHWTTLASVSRTVSADVKHHERAILGKGSNYKHHVSDLYAEVISPPIGFFLLRAVTSCKRNNYYISLSGFGSDDSNNGGSGIVTVSPLVITETPDCMAL